jgi:membrane-associated phospholipid phosphatase
MNNTLDNWIKLYNLLCTILVGSLVLFSSIINGDLKWFPTLVSPILIMLALGTIESMDDTIPHTSCNILNSGQTKSFTDLNTFFISFVASFMIYPSFYYDNKKPYLVLFFLVTLFGNIYTRITIGCNTGTEIVAGLIIGIASGIGCFYAWHNIDKERFTYFYDDDNSSEQCTRPSGQRFKCSVYKGGELIQTL